MKIVNVHLLTLIMIWVEERQRQSQQDIPRLIVMEVIQPMEEPEANICLIPHLIQTNNSNIRNSKCSGDSLINTELHGHNIKKEKVLKQLPQMQNQKTKHSSYINLNIRTVRYWNTQLEAEDSRDSVAFPTLHLNQIRTLAKWESKIKRHYLW